jgi:hypothetical protein
MKTKTKRKRKKKTYVIINNVYFNNYTFICIEIIIILYLYNTLLCGYVLRWASWGLFTKAKQEINIHTHATHISGKERKNKNIKNAKREKNK